MPSDEQISHFIYNNDFGYSEFDADMEVLSVRLYRESAEILGTLRAGISLDEKKRRKEEVEQHLEWQFY
jgi:hypothetical protein